LAAVVLGTATRAAADEPGWAEGQWIGGFEGVDGTVYVSAEVDGEAGALTGSLELPLQGDGAVKLEQVKATADSLRFDVRGSKTRLAFEGHRREPGHITGTVRQGRGAATFELLKVAKLPVDRLDAIAGTYELEPGHHVLVARSQGGLIYVDQDRGRVGALFALDDRTLIGGPSLGSGYPIELKIEVPAASGAAVDRIKWTWRGGDTALGVRRHPYRAEAVGFESGGVHLAGTLLLPARPGPHPAVVMIHGSGAATRDALWPWADMYARAGIAVLIHDKRGSGASTGSWSAATFDDLADDAHAAVRLLQARPEIDPRRVGLHGMSQGGWIAPLVARRAPDVAFIIAESAPAMTPVEHERLRVPYQLAADGFAPELIAHAVSFMDQKFDVARTGEGWDGLQASMVRGAREGWLSYVNPPPSLENLRWNWDHILSYDPAPALEALNCPVLVLYGGLDTIVPARVHRDRMQAALERARTRDVTIKVFDQANHAFLHAVTGGRRESPALKGFVDGYLGTHIAWLSERL
jgi:dipeptidyl aminopeptidase/acylaminoacyl peptidase